LCLSLIKKELEVRRVSIVGKLVLTLSSFQSKQKHSTYYNIA